MAEAQRAKLCGEGPTAPHEQLWVILQHALCQLLETQTLVNRGEPETRIHFKISNEDFDLKCTNRIDMSHLNKQHTSQWCQLCLGGSNTFVTGLCICLD